MKKLVALLLALFMFGTACNADQAKAYLLESEGVEITDGEAQAIADYYTRQAALSNVPSSPNVLSRAQLARLAQCESGGNPRATNPSGKYTGLYQFDQQTWNSVAKGTQWNGVRAKDAPAAVQDAMARRLYAKRGRAPWPVCGRRI